MKKLTKYELTSEFEIVKENLDEYPDYAALTEDDDNVHFREIPDMVDIALWDNTNEEIIMIRGREYNAYVYPTDRYTPIGIEVIPRSHMKDGYTRIMSLKYMHCDTPMIGGKWNYVLWGLYNNDIDGADYNRSLFPSIQEKGKTEFGAEQEILFWSNILNVQPFICSDRFSNNDASYRNHFPNPFTKNQWYSNTSYNAYAPSPYLENMLPNPIFFTENKIGNYTSCLPFMDGKGETAKVLNQLAVNLGNEDWKTETTIPSTTSETLGWDKIAPAAQCTWMYCVDEKYKDNPIFGQGCWYLPTIGEMCYVVARRDAIDRSLTQINNVIPQTAYTIVNSYTHAINTFSNTHASFVDMSIGRISRYDKQQTTEARAFLTI